MFIAMKISIRNRGNSLSRVAKACFFACLYHISLAEEFRCWKSNLSAHKILESYDYGYPPTNETEVCSGIKVCETTWQQIYPGSRLLIIKQGCQPSGLRTSLTKYHSSCRESECVANYVEKTSECPFGPQALCCCTTSLCNSNVVKYNITCSISSNFRPQIENNKNSTESKTDSKIVKSCSDIIIVPLVAGTLLLFLVVTVLINWFGTQRKHRPCNEVNNDTVTSGVRIFPNQVIQA